MATAKPDLTYTEAAKAFHDFAAEIGSRCDAYIMLEWRGLDAGFLSASIYPSGMANSSDKTRLRAKAKTFRELLLRVTEKWAEHSDLRAANMIRAMALKIIEITADQGECTDAALRAEFDGADVVRFGERACEQATEMASNGPFSIVTLTGANDAQAA